MNNKYSKFYALLNVLGIDNSEKSALVSEYSNGRTSSLKELSGEELENLETYLQNLTGKSQQPKGWRQPKKSKPASNEELVKLRKKVIALLAYSLGWNCYDKEKNKMVADMPRIYEWVKKYGKHNPKEFNSYNKKELSDLVSQVEIIVKKEIVS